MLIGEGRCPANTPRSSDMVFSCREANSTNQLDLEEGSASSVVSRSSTHQLSTGGSDNASGDAPKSEEPLPALSAARQTGKYRHGRAFLWLNAVRWRGVLAMIAGVFAQSLSWGMNMAYGTILAFYCQFLIPDVSKTLAALAGTIPPFCLMALSLPWGRLLDAGYQRTLNILAGVFLTGGKLLSFRNLPQLAVQLRGSQTLRTRPIAQRAEVHP